MQDNVVSIDRDSQLEELKQRCIDYKAQISIYCQLNKRQEVMIDNLHSELDVTRLQHNNALAKLEDNGIK